MRSKLRAVSAITQTDGLAATPSRTQMSPDDSACGLTPVRTRAPMDRSLDLSAATGGERYLPPRCFVKGRLSMFARTGVGNRRHLGCGLLGACPIAATAWADPPTLVAGLERFGGTSTVLPAPRRLERRGHQSPAKQRRSDLDLGHASDKKPRKL